MNRKMKLLALLLVMLTVLHSGFALADGAYEYLKTLMSTNIGAVQPPASIAASDLTSEIEGATVFLMSLSDGGSMGIYGRNAQNEFEGTIYYGLTPEQLTMYTVAVCDQFDTIDSARTTASMFIIYFSYGDGDDDHLIVTNAAMAKSVSEGMMEIWNNNQ